MSKHLFSRKGIVYLDRIDYGDWFIMGAGALADEDVIALADSIYQELGLGWIDIDNAEKHHTVVGDRYDVTKVWLDGSLHQTTLIFHSVEEWKRKHVVAFRVYKPYPQPKI